MHREVDPGPYPVKVVVEVAAVFARHGVDDLLPPPVATPTTPTIRSSKVRNNVVAVMVVRKVASVTSVALALAILVVGCSSGADRSQDVPFPRNNGRPVVAAGDIAGCDSKGDEATAKLLAEIDGTIIAALGDNAYPNGSVEDYRTLPMQTNKMRTIARP